MTIQNEIIASTWDSTALVVEPVEQPHDRQRFIRFPWQVYAGNPYWVPPLLIERRHNRGIDAVLYYETFREAMRKGYQRAELSLIVESNMTMRRTVEALGAQIAKTYRVYEKLL